MRTAGLWGICVLLLATASASVDAAVVRVPGDQPTIQAGIDAASSGDTVLVAPGVYSGPGNRDLDVHGKDMAIVSEGGSAVTCIDCEGDEFDPHRGFHIPGDSPVTLRIEGFEILNGYADGNGGGLYIDSAALTLVDCAVRHCRACTAWNRGDCNGGMGGGMYCVDCDIVATDCVFSFNAVGRSGLDCDGTGGGICLGYCTGSFTRCDILANQASCNGGGVAGGGASASDVVFTSCLFDWNRAGVGGNPGSGGSYSGAATFRDVTFKRSYASHARGGAVSGGGIFEDVVFWANFAEFGGGALYCLYDNEVVVKGASFVSNSTGQGGAAILCDGGTFEQILIYDNTAYFGAGAIRCFGDATFSNLTIVDNEGDFFALAIECWGAPVFSNVIIAFHDAWTDEPVITCEGGASPTFYCCNIYGNETGDWVGCIADQYGVNDNISADPQFCDMGAGDFRISASSPCAPQNSGCGELIGVFGVGCEASTTEALSWGRIKALYRQH